MIKRVLIGFIVVSVIITISFLTVFKQEFFGISASAEFKSKAPTVIIDAGHGGLANTIKFKVVAAIPQ